MSKVFFAMLFMVVFLPASAQAGLYEINAGGILLHDNASGDLGAIAQSGQRQFFYTAAFDFDTINPVVYRTNSEGYKVYPLTDGGNKFHNTATIWDDADTNFNDIPFSSDLVEVEFADNQSYNWTSDPELEFFGDRWADGRPFDFIVFGFFITDEDALIAANNANDDSAVVTTDFYLTLFFEDTLLDTDDTPTPVIIDPNDIIITAGEFAQKNRHGNIVGWAQILGEGSGVEISAVPIPGAAFLLGSGLIGLAGVSRGKR